MFAGNVACRCLEVGDEKIIALPEFKQLLINAERRSNVVEALGRPLAEAREQRRQLGDTPKLVELRAAAVFIFVFVEGVPKRWLR